MAKVLGLGGVFFKAKDPDKLGQWYKEHLHMPVEAPYGASFHPGQMPDAAFSVWAPFQATTEYFEPSKREFMFNLVVDDLDGALEQVKAAGAVVMDEIEEMEFGRFGWFIDPEGNKVELWEPANNVL